MHSRQSSGLCDLIFMLWNPVCCWNQGPSLFMGQLSKCKTLGFEFWYIWRGFKQTHSNFSLPLMCRLILVCDQVNVGKNQRNDSNILSPIKQRAAEPETQGLNLELQFSHLAARHVQYDVNVIHNITEIYNKYLNLSITVNWSCKVELSVVVQPAG